MRPVYIKWLGVVIALFLALPGMSMAADIYDTFRAHVYVYKDAIGGAPAANVHVTLKATGMRNWDTYNEYAYGYTDNNGYCYLLITYANFDEFIKLEAYVDDEDWVQTDEQNWVSYSSVTIYPEFAVRRDLA